VFILAPTDLVDGADETASEYPPSA